MPITYLLVDFENVKPTAAELRLLRGDHFRLWIFRGPQQKTFAADLAEAWQPLGAHVRFIHCTKAGKNALDFHIAFCLGMAHRENVAANRLARYVVVSNDGGFDTLFEFARSERCHVTKAPTIAAAMAAAEAMDFIEVPDAGAPTAGITTHLPQTIASVPGSKTSNSKSAPPAKKAAKTASAKRATMSAEDVTKILAFLREQPKNRPAKRSGLEHHIVSLLGNKVTEKVAQAVVNRLVHDKLLAVTGEKVEYRVGRK